jgi:hypothetical protein
MTRNEIIELANKAYGIDDGKPFHPSALLHLEIFAKLVAQHEREACAKVCEEMRTYVGRNNAVIQSSAQDCATAIRARGQA